MISVLTPLIGLTGMVFIVIGWIVSLPAIPPLRLSLLYGTGSFFLTLYSLLLGDPVFLFLNSAATILAFINAYRAVRAKDEKK